MGIASRARGNVHQVQEDPAALDVLQEAVSEPNPLRRALDQTRKVRQDEGLPPVTWGSESAKIAVEPGRQLPL